jgi:hypothetical protein
MNNTRYIIEGNLAIRETITRTEGVPLDKMLENLTAYQPIEIAPTPRNLRSITVRPRPNMQLAAQVIVGHDPMSRRISHKNCPARSNRHAPQSYLLHFPYGIFWFALNGNKMSGIEGERIVWSPQGWGYVWMKEPFANFDQQGWTPQMPNIFGDSRICFGANSVNGSLPLGHFIDQSINTFWTSEFNQDLENFFPYPSLKRWEDASPEDWPNWTTWADRPQPLRDKFKQFDEDMDWQNPVNNSTEREIPRLPMFHTFDNLERWLSELGDSERARLEATLDVLRLVENDE